MNKGDLVYVSGHDRKGLWRDGYGLVISGYGIKSRMDYLWTWYKVLLDSEVVEVHEDFIRPTRTTVIGIV